MHTQKAFKTGSEFPALEPGKLRLYSMRHCPYAQRARIVLAHKNIPHETININLKEKPDWFLKLNPLGKVPAIQKDDVLVYESLVICEYLDEVYPGEKIVPSDPYQRAKDKMFLERFSKVVSTYYTMLRSGDMDAKKEGATLLFTELKVVEEELKARNTKFFGGDKPMLVDFACWPHVERVVAVGTVIPALSISKESFPLFSAWIENISNVPAVKETITPSKVFHAFSATVKSGTPDYDVGLEE